MDRPLPVLEVTDELRDALARRGVAVLVAPPGTGKTTAVAPLLLGEPWVGGGRIVVTEPRRIAARAAATRMAALAGEPVGGRFGYAVRGERRGGPDVRVEVVTEGLLLRRLQNDPTLDGVSCVVFDEFHERSVDSDLGLALALDVRASLRPDLRILVMSATLQTGPVAAALGDGALGDAPVVEATTPMFDVETRYRPGSAHDPIEQRAATVVAEALRSDEGDIVVFLPGRGELRRCARELARTPEASGVDVFELHGSVPPEDQDRVLAPTEPGRRRRVVLATSVAESSVTVPGVRVVVDGGRRRHVRVDVATGLPVLSTQAASRASADQRRGRAGRTAPGVAYRLWAESEHRHRPETDQPELHTADLAGLVLQVHAWGVDDPGRLRWVDAPPDPAWHRGEHLLGQLGALDADGALTRTGRAMAELGNDPRLAAVADAGRAGGRRDLAAELAAVLESDRAGATDVVERITEVRAGRAPGDTRAALRVWRRALEARPGTGAVDPHDVAELLLAGYPDRVARRRDRAGDWFHLRTGGEVAVRDPSLARADWLVVVDLDAGAGDRSGRVHLAAAVADATVRAQLAGAVTTDDDVRWDPAEGHIVARRRSRLGAITLDDRPLSKPPAPELRAALVEAVEDRGVSLFGNLGAAAVLRARVACLRALGAGDEDWPDWSDVSLGGAALGDAALGDAASGGAGVIDAAVSGARSLEDLRRTDLAAVLRRRLTHHQHRLLDELAPTHWSTASGRRLTLDYGALDGADASVLARARIADLLGTDRHPHVGGGRLAVTLELLSPAGRPVQRTTDLSGFWRGSYAAVRADLRGRYPKHPWPERPWEAVSSDGASGDRRRGGGRAGRGSPRRSG